MNMFNVCIIAEGNEEYQFFETMKNSGVIPSNLSIDVYNAEGYGYVAPLFQEYNSYELYDCVTCVYDVDYRQFEKDSPYLRVFRQLIDILGNEDAAKAVSFCTNPNFLQIYLLSMRPLSEIALFATSKKTNTPFVHLCWPEIAKKKVDENGKDQTKDYDATKWQLQIMNAHFLEEKQSYITLLDHLNDLPNDYLLPHYPGSNVGSLIRALLFGDTMFFKQIIEKTDDD